MKRGLLICLLLLPLTRWRQQQTISGTFGYGSPGSATPCSKVGDQYVDISAGTLYTAVTISLTSTASSCTWQAGGGGAVPTVIDTSSTVAVSATTNSEFHFNENATAAQAVTYNLPPAVQGMQKCFSNAYNGSAANTGVLTLATSGSGQFIIFTDGTLSASGGNVTSGGAAADAACVSGVDSTHWMLYVQRGTWAKH